MIWKINRERCLRCGGCVGVCPTDALELTENGVKWDEEKCIFCGKCETVCPVGAINVEGDEE